MSGPFGDNGDTTGYDGGSNDSGATGNPAWNDVLGVIPQELHEQVTPHFQKWDNNVQNLVQKVHSEYEPWKEVVKSGFDPQTTQFALNLLNTLNSDPRQVYDALRDHYGFTDEQAQQQINNLTNGNSGQGQGEPNNPYAQQIQDLARQQQAILQQNQMMADILTVNRQREIDSQADAQLDAELTQLRAKHGDYDERYVLAMMGTGMSGQDAVKQYFNMANNIQQTYVPQPLIMGTGGGAPGQSTDVKKLSDRGTKDLTVQMLRHAFRQQ